VAESARLVGVLTDAGRALSKPKGDGFAALSWLENDGDTALQEAAYQRPGLEGAAGNLTFTLGGQQVVHLSGRGADARIADACRTAALVIVAKGGAEAPCLVMTEEKLREFGALAVYPGAKTLRIVGAKHYGGVRLWTGN
jgi:competence protein ComEC